MAVGTDSYDGQDDDDELEEVKLQATTTLPRLQKRLLEIVDMVAKRHLWWLSPVPTHSDVFGSPRVEADTFAGARGADNPLKRTPLEVARDPDRQAATKLTKEQNNPRTLYATPIRELMDLFAGNLVAVGTAMVDCAIGHKVAILDEETGQLVEVYDKPPDAKVGELILSRLMGKPEINKTVEHTGNAGGNVVIYIPNNDRPVVGKDGTPIVPTTAQRPPTAFTLPGKEPLPYEQEYKQYTDTEDIREEEYTPDASPDPPNSTVVDGGAASG